MKTNFTVENAIILSGSIFGSVYLFSTSLNLINDANINKYKLPFFIKVMNGFTMLSSGILFVCCCGTALQLLE